MRADDLFPLALAFATVFASVSLATELQDTTSDDTGLAASTSLKVKSDQHLDRRDYGDIDDYDPNNNDDSGDTAYEFPGVDIKTGSSSPSSSYVSAPATYRNCFWNVDNKFKFTSRLQVANHSCSSGNFSSTNANSRYFIKDTVEHQAGYYNASQVVIGSTGVLRLMQAAVPIGSTATKAVAAQIHTAWTDITSGSVRTVALGDTNAGAVYGMFFYGNQDPWYETDIELLTTWPKNVSFTNQYALDYNGYNYDVSTTNSTLYNGGSIAEWHEYRIDWVPGYVLFYVDGNLRLNKTLYVPRGPGALFWNSWSNNGPWSHGPARKANTFYIQSIDLYVNRTGVACGP